jgi:hypothetical protein
MIQKRLKNERRAVRTAAVRGQDESVIRVELKKKVDVTDE